MSVWTFMQLCGFSRGLKKVCIIICIVWLFAGTTAPWKLARAARRDTGGTRSPSGWGRSQVRGKKTENYETNRDYLYT